MLEKSPVVKEARDVMPVVKPLESLMQFLKYIWCFRCDELHRDTSSICLFYSALLFNLCSNGPARAADTSSTLSAWIANVHKYKCLYCNFDLRDDCCYSYEDHYWDLISISQYFNQLVGTLRK